MTVRRDITQPQSYAGEGYPMHRTLVNLHAVESHSRANGPGERIVLWFQGCTLGCAGCFNPSTHSTALRQMLPIASILERIHAAGPHDGLTITGGEPFQQSEGLMALLQAVREQTDLSVLVFSGYRREEIERRPWGAACLGLIDVLVDDRYVPALHHGRGLRGSTNQRVHVLTPRHTLSEIEDTPDGELRIDPGGVMTFSGVHPLLVPAVMRRSALRPPEACDASSC